VINSIYSANIDTLGCIVVEHIQDQVPNGTFNVLPATVSAKSLSQSAPENCPKMVPIVRISKDCPVSSTLGWSDQGNDP